MTTLSKEDVVQALEALESMDDFARMDIGVDPIGPYRVLREFIAAHADIVEVNKALVAENERLKARLEVADHGWDGISCRDETIKLQDSSIKELRTALAAAETDNERLRKALDKILTTDWVSDRVRSTAKTALAQPRDDSALREMIAGVYEECEQVCENRKTQGTGSVAILDGAIAEIRALAEKKLASLTS